MEAAVIAPPSGPYSTPSPPRVAIAYARGRGLPAAAAAFNAEMDKIIELVPDSLLALKAQGPRFQKEKLQIGMTAPDIVGDDLDGSEFKLSDYRGKVVVLDFWGDW